jgi:hypothetical protein
MPVLLERCGFIKYKEETLCGKFIIFVFLLLAAIIPLIITGLRKGAYISNNKTLDF